MIKIVRFSDEAHTIEAAALVIGGMLFQLDAGAGFGPCICERTVGDYGLSVGQFRHMVELEGLRQMLDYYPDAFLHIGQNRYVQCSIVETEKIEA